MSKLCFFTNPWASGVIRGRQVANRLGNYAVVDPERMHADDICIAIKCIIDDDMLNGVRKAYVDVVDSYACIPWLRDHPNAGVIAISHLGGRYLREVLKESDVRVIIEHHCNFERQRKAMSEPTTVGYVGELDCFHLDTDDMSRTVGTLGMQFIYLDKFETRDDVCDFYRDVDIQLTFRKDVDDYGKITGMLKNPLKLANAGSFGIPTIGYPEVTYTDEWDGCFIPARSVDEAVYWLDRLKRDSVMYAVMSDRAFEQAERYHIDNIAPMYMQLLDNKEYTTHDYTMNQIVNLNDAPCCNYPFKERIARRGNDHIDVDKSMANLACINDIAEKRGLKMWLMFGTLLGAVRDGALIARDRDVDLGVFWHDFDKLSDVIIELKCMGFELIRTEADDNVVTIMRDDEYVDFYLFRSSNGRYVCNQPGLNAIIDSARFDELDTICLCGKVFNIPSASKSLFRLWYGDDWRTPVDYKWAYTKVKQNA